MKSEKTHLQTERTSTILKNLNDLLARAPSTHSMVPSPCVIDVPIRTKQCVERDSTKRS